MPKIAVHISELPRAHGGELAPGEVPRSHVWFGDAEDEDAARSAAYADWERRYGPAHPPRSPIEVIANLGTAPDPWALPAPRASARVR